MKKKVIIISVPLVLMTALGIAHRLIAQTNQTTTKDSPVQSALRHSPESNYNSDCIQAKGYCFLKRQLHQGIYLHK